MMSTVTDTAPEPQITIREIEGEAEMRIVEDLQRDVWGIPDLDIVPLYHLAAAKAAGGALLGAFAGDEMIGFAYGFVGLENGRMTHHSHMLAVKPEYRNFKVGFRLKLAQREFVLSQGIDEMTWTFDPIQSMNAYFNFSRLGVIADTYYVDFYGTHAASFLHRTGTDRLWVTWKLADERVKAKIAGGLQSGTISDGVHPIVVMRENGEPLFSGLGEGTSATIEIPRSIAEFEKEDGSLAVDWRMATRRAFTEALDAGFRVTDFCRGERSGRYVLEKVR